jgi:hypothetical protein
MTSDRRRYQQEVANLLETISHGVQEFERLRARGLRGRTLAEHEAELATARRQLAMLIHTREHETAPTAAPAIPRDAPMQPPPNRRRPARAWTPALR